MQNLVVAESVEGKYGPQIKDVAGVYYSFSKFYRGPTEFPVGTSLKADVYVTEKGGKYLNTAEVIGIEAGEAPAVKTDKKAPSKAVDVVKPSKTSENMTKAEWGLKDRSMLVGGLSHDAAVLGAVIVNVRSLTTTSEALVVYKELLEGMLSIREQIK